MDAALEARLASAARVVEQTRGRGRRASTITPPSIELNGGEAPASPASARAGRVRSTSLWQMGPPGTDLSKQALQFLPADVLESKNLSALNLACNCLSALPVLGELSSITSLDLSSNEFVALPPQLSVLANLKALHFRHNALTSLSSALTVLSALTSINFAHNRLTDVASLALPELERVELRNNELVTLPSRCGVPTYLNASSNRLVTLPDLSPFTALQELQLAHNSLQQLPDSLSLLGVLSTLDVSHNRLSSLPALPTALISLDLRSNRLTTLPASFAALDRVETVLLSLNLLSSPGALDGWRAARTLRTLNVADNALTAASLAGVATLTQLRELVLARNALAELPSLEGLSLLRVLDVSHNALTALPDVAALCPQLSSLSLAYNKFTALPAGVLGAPRLRTLSVAGNGQLTALPLLDMCRKLPLLEHLDVAASSLPSSALATIPFMLTSLVHLDVSGCALQPDALTALTDVVASGAARKQVLTLTNWLCETGSRGGSGIATPAPAASAASAAAATAAAVASLGPASQRWLSAAETQGKRPSMEDEMVLLPGFRGNANETLAAVLDGHGGREVATFVAHQLPGLFQQCLREHANVETAITTVFTLLDSTLRTSAVGAGRQGCTVLLAYLCGGGVWIANAGDSRAVLCRDAKAQRLSVDHKPSDRAEELRIRALRGAVNQEGRVNGSLAVSRAIGDFDFAPFVVPTPFVQFYELRPSDSFLILACDGLWDVMSDQHAVDLLLAAGPTSHGASILRDIAYASASTDNISVLVLPTSN